MENHAQSSNWHHVLAFLSLAAGLGLACGVALGGIALLLAAPAYGAQPSAPGVSSDVLIQVSGSVAHARIVIGAQETVIVELEYQQPLQRDGNRFSPRFPMVVVPRQVRIGPF